MRLVSEAVGKSLPFIRASADLVRTGATTQRKYRSECQMCNVRHRHGSSRAVGTASIPAVPQMPETSWHQGCRLAAAAFESKPCTRAVPQESGMRVSSSLGSTAHSLSMRLIHTRREQLCWRLRRCHAACAVQQQARHERLQAAAAALVRVRR